MTSTHASIDQDSNQGPPAAPAVRTWLVIVFVMILLMTAIGGTTRLTGSGLSMVTWHPLMGALPPLSQDAWQAVFAHYKETPQYLLVNDWMTLADFKRIFFWEYIHRLLGRSIGVVVFVPWLWFLIRRQLSRRLAWQTVGLLVLGGSQGLLGWYMVMSGLVDRPHVSHLRLAAHLLLAFIVAQAVVWVRLSLDAKADDARPAGLPAVLSLWGLWLFVLVQSAWGAFMAGTRAGWFAHSFPDVNGVYWPGSLVAEGSLWHAVIFEVGPIHATHRLLAWVLCAAAAVVLGVAWRDRAPQLRRPLSWIAGLLVLQICLGAATVMLSVPTAIAVLHQVVALLLLSAVTTALQRAR